MVSIFGISVTNCIRFATDLDESWQSLHYKLSMPTHSVQCHIPPPPAGARDVLYYDALSSLTCQIQTICSRGRITRSVTSVVRWPPDRHDVHPTALRAQRPGRRLSPAPDTRYGRIAPGRTTPAHRAGRKSQSQNWKRPDSYFHGKITWQEVSFWTWPFGSEICMFRCVSARETRLELGIVLTSLVYTIFAKSHTVRKVIYLNCVVTSD